MSFLKDAGSAIVSGLGSIASSLVGSYTSKKLNDENIAFQEEQNRIERERADNTLMRTVADAHRAGLSAFDAQSVPLGQTSAPQNDVAGVSSSMNALTSALGETGSATLNYMLETSKLSQSKKESEWRMEIGDKQFAVDSAYKSAQTDVANAEAMLKSKENASYEEKIQAEIDLKLAQSKLLLAQESQAKVNTSIASSKEAREKALHQLDVNLKSIELQARFQEFNHNAETFPIMRDMMKNAKKMSDTELESFAKKLGLELDNLTLEAMRKLLVNESVSTSAFSYSVSKSLDEKKSKRLLKSVGGN